MRKLLSSILVAVAAFGIAATGAFADDDNGDANETELVCTIRAFGVEFEAWFRFDTNGDGRAEFDFEGFKPTSEVEGNADPIGVSVRVDTDTDGDARVKISGNFAGLAPGSPITNEGSSADDSVFNDDDRSTCPGLSELVFDV